MKVTPNLKGRYHPRVSATYILLSPQVGVSHDIEVQVRTRALKAAPLVGIRVFAQNLTDAVTVFNDTSDATALFVNGVDEISFVEDGDYLEFAELVYNPVFTPGKGLTDAVTTSDSLTFSVSAVRSDTMVGGDTFTSVGSGILSLTSNGATADSGLIFTQGYTDTLDYFAEDYVGTSSSF